MGAALLVVGSAVADLSQWKVASSDGVSNTGGTWGLILLAVGLVLASVAAVSCEYAYKVVDVALIEFFFHKVVAL